MNQASVSHLTTVEPTNASRVGAPGRQPFASRSLQRHEPHDERPDDDDGSDGVQLKQRDRDLAQKEEDAEEHERSPPLA